MPSEKKLSVKNLAALGADRLAELLLELAEADPVAKRQLRLELASRSGGDDVVAEIRKRLAAIAKSRSFVDWQKTRALARDLGAQRAAIITHVAPTRPAEAVDLLWRLLEMAPSIYERCDDSNGTIGSIMDEALENLGEVAATVKLPVDKLADRIFASVCSNDYAQFDSLITKMAGAVGKDGLGLLKAKFEHMAPPPAQPKGENRRVVAISSSGPIYEHDYIEQRHARLVRSALTEIADSLGDVDDYAARFSPAEQANPAIAADIAERLFAAGRAEEALAAIDKAEANMSGGRSWPDWERVRIDVLDGLGRAADAQKARWAIFERALNADYLRTYLKQLPDFDDEEAADRAMDHARQYASFHQALAFLVEWPAHDAAAGLILDRHSELDGDHYWLLTPAADALDQRYPLAATLMLRAMIGFALDKARSKRYRHAIRHLQTCEYHSARIDDWSGHPNHETWLADLKLRHERKSGFWNA